MHFWVDSIIVLYTGAILGGGGGGGGAKGA